MVQKSQSSCLAQSIILLEHEADHLCGFPIARGYCGAIRFAALLIFSSRAQIHGPSRHTVAAHNDSKLEFRTSSQSRTFVNANLSAAAPLQEKQHESSRVVRMNAHGWPPRLLTENAGCATSFCHQTPTIVCSGVMTVSPLRLCGIKPAQCAQNAFAWLKQEDAISRITRLVFLSGRLSRVLRLCVQVGGYFVLSTGIASVVAVD